MRNVQVTITADEQGDVWAVNEKGDYEASSNPTAGLPELPASLVKAFKESGKESLLTYLRLL